MNSSSRLLIVVVAIVMVLGPTAVWAQAPLKVGEVRSYRAETPHPYPLGTEARPAVWTDRIVSHGATFIRVHFTGLHLAEGDYVTVANPDGRQSWTYTGRGPKGRGDVWAFAIDGDTAIVTVHGGRRPGHGYRIDSVGHGTVRLNPTPEVVCGTDGREDVACHIGETGFETAQNPVSRLLFQSGAFLYVCTGWLVDGSNPNTLVTNNHCISTQNETDTLQATFNFQFTTCGGNMVAQTSSFSGGMLLKTSSVDRRGRKEGFDYTLLTLQGNPEAAWGELVATGRSVSVGEQIWFIQHPGGNEKEVGYYEDSEKTMLCRVAEVNQTYGRSAGESQTAYGCDSEGGSSGSPIIDPVTGEVIALHHFGGVDNNPCLNSGTSMSSICADAGPLLNCAGGNGGGCTLLPSGSPCTSNGECCSGNCKGKPGSRTCK